SPGGGVLLLTDLPYKSSPRNPVSLPITPTGFPPNITIPRVPPTKRSNQSYHSWTVPRKYSHSRTRSDPISEKYIYSRKKKHFGQKIVSIFFNSRDPIGYNNFLFCMF